MDETRQRSWTLKLKSCPLCSALTNDDAEKCECGCRVLTPLAGSTLEAIRDDAQQAMRIGVACVGGAALFTLLTKRVAEATGFAFYLIPVGAFAYGSVSFVRAWRVWSKLKELPSAGRNESP